MSLCDAYPTATICRALGLPRGSFYRRGRADEDQPLKDALLELAARWPTYGYRRLTVMLRRQGQPVNGKRVRRLMHELGLAAEPPARKPRTTNSGHTPGPTPAAAPPSTRPDGSRGSRSRAVGTRRPRDGSACPETPSPRTSRGNDTGRTDGGWPRTTAGPDRRRRRAGRRPC